MRYFLYLSIYLVMQIIAWAITPALPLFARPRWGLIDNANRAGIEPRLPLWLAWFDTPDNSLFGDNKWMISHPKATHWTMVAWLYRNSLYGFKWTTLACRVDYPNLLVWEGNPLVNRNNGVTGRFKAWRNVGSDYWQWKYVKKLVGDWGLMLNFGWQLDEFVSSKKHGNALFQFSPRFVKIQ